MRFTSHSVLAVFVLSIATFGQSINLDTQVKGSRLPMWAVDSGSANAYAIATIGALGPSLRTGSRFAFIATHANTTASTLAVDGGSAIAIKKNVSTALVSGDIALSQVIEVTYDGTNFQIVGPGALTFAAISGTLGCSQLPTFTGDVTNSACAMTLATVTVPKGGTGQTSLTAHNFILGEGASAVGFLSLGAHQVPVGAASADPSGKTMPDCQDTSGNHLNFTQSTDAFSCGTSSSGGGGGGSSGPEFGYVQCTLFDISGTNFTSKNCASTVNETVGDDLWGTCNVFVSTAGPTLSFSNTHGDSWTLVTSHFFAGSGYQQNVFHAVAGSSGSDTFTCTISATNAFWTITVSVLNGITTGTDVSPCYNEPGTGSTIHLSCAFTTAHANELAFILDNAAGSLSSTPLVQFGGCPVISTAAVYLCFRPLRTTGKYITQTRSVGTGTYSDLVFTLY